MDEELEKFIQEQLGQNQQEFSGFPLTAQNSRMLRHTTVYNSHNKNNEWNSFFIPYKYNGTDVYYIPKSYVERGYAYTNPEGQVQWYGSPILLKPEVQQFLKPARLEDSALQYITDQYEYFDNYDPVDGTRSHFLNVPSFQDGYIIPRSKLDVFADYKTPVLRWDNLNVIPTGMSMYQGNPVYMGYNQWDRGYSMSYIGSSGDGRNNWYEAPRSILGSFFDSVGLSDVGDFLEGPASALLFFVPGMQPIAAALQVGNAIRNENWGQLALSLIAFNTPGADGSYIAKDTLFDIPQIGSATAGIASTLGVSNATANLIMQGTVEFVANGFDIEKALRAVAANYVGNLTGSQVSSLLRNEGFQALGAIAGNVTKASTRAMLMNEPVDVAARNAFIDSSLDQTLRSVPQYNSLAPTSQNSVKYYLTELAKNPDADFSALLKRATVDAVSQSILDEMPESKELGEQYKIAARDMITGLAYGKDLDAVLMNTMKKAASSAVRDQLRNQNEWAWSVKPQSQKFGFDNFAEFQAAQNLFGDQYKTTVTKDMYDTLIGDIKSTTFNADKDDKIATVEEARYAANLAGFNNFVFDNKLYTIGGKSTDYADGVFGKSENEFVFDGSKLKDPNEAIMQAYKAGFNTVKLPNNQTYNIPPEVQQQIQKSIDFPGVFDASKYDNIKDAANAAAAVDENKFTWKDGAVYTIRAPESALNQIKEAKTFNEAFAIAQKNLGEGNVFEWDGKLYVNRTKEQDAALPFDGNKYDDRGAAAYAAHLKGKDTFTWGGNTWKLPSDYASQISAAVGQDPFQSAAETKRLLDANIKAADPINTDKIQLINTGVPVLDQIIGSIAFVQGKSIESTGEGLKQLARAHALRTGTSFENALVDVGNMFNAWGQKIQLPGIAEDFKEETKNISRARAIAENESNPFIQQAIIGGAFLSNPLGWLGAVASEAGEDAPETLATLGALAILPASGTAATAIAAGTAIFSAYKTYGAAGYDYYKELKEQGKSEDEARAGGNVMGIVNAVIEAPLEFVGDRALMIPYLDGIKGAAKTAAKTFINPVTVAAATEYAQEFLQGVSSRVVKGEPQNIAQDMASASYASFISAGTSIGFLAPAAINQYAQVALDRSGNPVTFQEFIGRGESSRDIDLSTLNLSTKIATLDDGTSLSLGGLQVLMPQTGLSRDIVSTYSPDLTLTRNTVVAYGPNDTPILFKNSQPFFDKYLISVGDIPTISQTEAKNLLKDQGRQNPTQEEINFVIDNAKGANDEDIAKQVADPFVVTVEEVKQAAQAAGYAITDKEAQELAGEKLQSETLPALEQQFNPLATTEQEVRQFFEERGYTPTQDEINRFIKSIPEVDVKAEIQSYVDPRMLYPADIKALAEQEGYEISDARARELSGQKDKYASLDALRAEFDAGAVTLDEARAMFAKTPYKPSDEEIQQFIGSKSESQIQQDIQNYVEPRYVTAQDIKDAAAQEGYTISDEQAEALAGQKDKLSAIAQFRADVNPQAVTEAEARAFFSELGYQPTEDELQEFVASRSEEQIRADISAYVDPRYVTMDEVKRVAAEEGYTVTDEEALALTGQRSQQEILDLFRRGADEKATLQSEAQAFFDQYGYTPTPEELAMFTGSTPEATALENIKSYIDPRFVTLDEVKEVARSEGYDITDDEAAALVGQKSQEEALAAFRQQIDPKAVIDAEAQAFFTEFGYTPSNEELSLFIRSRSEDQVRADIQTYVDPRQVTEAEARARFGEVEPGYKYTPEEIAMFTRMGADVSQEDVLGGIPSYIDPRFVSRQEVEDAYAALGLTSPMEQDITRFMGQFDQEGLGGRVGEYLPTALSNRLAEAMSQYDQLTEGQKKIADDLVQMGDTLTNAIAKAREQVTEDLGGQITDLTKTVTDQYAELTGTQKKIADDLIAQGNTLNDAIIKAKEEVTEDLGGQITDLTKTVGDQYNELSAGQKKIADDLVAQGESLADAITKAKAEVVEDLGGQITDLGKTVDDRYNELSEGQKQIADDLVAQGSTLTDAIIKAKEEVISTTSTMLSDQQKLILDTMSGYEKSGIARDEALQKAISDVGGTISSTEQSLLGKISDLEKSGLARDAATQQAFKDLNQDLSKQLQDIKTENEQRQRIESLNQTFAQNLQTIVNQSSNWEESLGRALSQIPEADRPLINLTAAPIQQLQQQQTARRVAQQQKGQQMAEEAVQALTLPTPAAAPPTPTSEIAPLYTGDPGDAFISPLAPFLAKVEQGSYTQPQQPETPQQKDLETMRREQGYFTYGQPSEIDQNIGAGQDPYAFYMATGMPGNFKAGGMVAPLMAEGGGTRYGRYAGGGLNLVPHTGKMRVDFREGDAVTGAGDGQSDDIPAMLADGEFVIPADVVAALGNGSTKAGSDKLYDMMHSIRAHVRSAKPEDLPPPVKSPLDYISKRPKATRR